MSIKVVVKEIGTDEVVKSIPCDTESKAEKVEDGLNRNMNHEQFYTDIVKD